MVKFVSSGFFLAVIWAYCLCIPNSRLIASDLPTAKLIEAVLARKDAVFSGHITFVERLGPPGDEHKLPEMKCIFSGKSWRISFEIDKDRMDKLCHRGTLIEFKQTGQPNNTMRRIADISTEKPVFENDPAPPIFAGTLWHPVTKDYLRACYAL